MFWIVILVIILALNTTASAANRSPPSVTTAPTWPPGASIRATPSPRRKVTPSYTIGCKRIILSNTLYPAYVRDNVTLHAGDGGRGLLVWRGAREVRVDAVPPYEIAGKPLKGKNP